MLLEFEENAGEAHFTLFGLTMSAYLRLILSHVAEQTRTNEDMSGVILSLKTQLLSTEQACALERSAHAQTKVRARENILMIREERSNFVRGGS